MTEYLDISKVEAADVVEPVTLAEAKTWLKVDYTDEDAMITDMITSARQAIEAYTNLALVDSDVTLSVTIDKSLRARLPFVRTIAEVEVTDTDDVILDADAYTIRGSYLSLNATGGYTITYSIEPGEIPKALKEAILMEVAQRYNNRGENKTGDGISESAKAKSDPYKLIWL